MAGLNTLTRVLAFREAGKVERCHGMSHHGSYTVAQHSWDAVSLLVILYPNEPPSQLLLSILYHDIAERWVGDTPSPALARWPALGKAYLEAEEQIQMKLLGYLPEADLSDESRTWLKAIDRLELYLWCHDQLALGNKHAEDWIKTLRQPLMDKPTPYEVRKFVGTYSWRRTANYEVMT